MSCGNKRSTFGKIRDGWGTPKCGIISIAVLLAAVVPFSYMMVYDCDLTGGVFDRLPPCSEVFTNTWFFVVMVMFLLGGNTLGIYTAQIAQARKDRRQGEAARHG